MPSQGPLGLSELLGHLGSARGVCLMVLWPHVSSLDGWARNQANDRRRDTNREMTDSKREGSHRPREQGITDRGRDEDGG